MAIRSALFALLTFCLPTAGTAAQTAAPAKPARAASAAAPTVTVSVSVATTATGVRFAALGPVKQTRLEVYDSSGGRPLDSDFLPGNVRDWAVAGRGLADGTYQCVLSARDLSGRLSVKQAAVLISGGTAWLSLGEAEVSGGVTPSGRSEEAGAATLATHDGIVGALTSTAGDLTLRTGDVLSGRDEERVRVTADGKVGVGTQKPESALDVAGEVRASEGFRFADGSRLAVDEKGALARTSADGQPLPALGTAASAATANRLAKFADSAGTLTDSALFESGGLVGVGTTSPEGTLHIQTPDTTVFKVVSTGSVSAGRSVFQMYRGAAAAASGWDFGYNVDQGSENFIIRELTNGVPNIRFALQKGTGDVGIGTTNPQSRLAVQTINFSYGLTHTNGPVTVGSYVDPTGGWLGTRSNHPLYLCRARRRG